jgi:hypothetical protein
MSFADKMAVWTLALDYLKVVLGYPVTIPALVLALCWLFRGELRRAIDAVQAASVPGVASVEVGERAALEKYNATIQPTAKEAVQSATHVGVAMQPIFVEVIASFFGLVARTLPLIPKADRLRFIAGSTAHLPEVFNTFRAALVKLAEDAPEVHALSAGDVLSVGGVGERAEVIKAPSM